jgi:hypothetical protein
MLNNGTTTEQQHQVAAGTGLHSSGGNSWDGRTYIRDDPDSQTSEKGWEVLAMEITARGKAELRTNIAQTKARRIIKPQRLAHVKRAGARSF